MQYAAPRTINEAISLLTGNPGSRILAGGTDLLARMNVDHNHPSLIVDIKKIPETTSISQGSDGSWQIGSAVSGAALADNMALRGEWPGVIEAMNLIGSTQIQSRASLGGNLCNASPAADAVPALIAAGARCLIAGPEGSREIAVQSVVTGPGKLSLASDELLIALQLPGRTAHGGDAYLRFIPRTEMDIAVVGAGVNLTLDSSGHCNTARVALGAVAPTALLLEEASGLLNGSTLDDAILDQLAEMARAACQPIDDKRGTIAYRRQVAGVLVCRAARIALQRAKERRT